MRRLQNFICHFSIVTSVQTRHCICRVQQLMLSNTAVKIGALLLFALPAVLVFGEIYSGITGQPATNGFIKIYSVLLMIPGTSMFVQLTAMSTFLFCLGAPILVCVAYILSMLYACQQLPCLSCCQAPSAICCLTT